MDEAPIYGDHVVGTEGLEDQIERMLDPMTLTVGDNVYVLRRECVNVFGEEIICGFSKFLKLQQSPLLLLAAKGRGGIDGIVPIEYYHLFWRWNVFDRFW